MVESGAKAQKHKLTLHELLQMQDLQLLPLNDDEKRISVTAAAHTNQAEDLQPAGASEKAVISAAG